MIKINNVKIFKNGKIDMDTANLGRQNEKNVTKLVFSFPEELDSYNKTIEFSFGTNKKFTDIIFNNEYKIDNNISKNINVDFQIVCTDIDGTEVFKSNVQSVVFENSINAVEPVPDAEAVSQWNTMLTELNEKIVEVEDIKEISDYAKEQGDYAKQEAEKVDSIVDYVVETSEEAKENSETALSISKGANQSLSFGDYATMINIFNALNNDIYRTGQNVLIVTLNVPDLWVSEVVEESISYTYTTDEDLTALLKEQGYIQVGYYKLSALETQKVDLTDYVKNTDYMTTSKPGLAQVASGYGVWLTATNALYVAKASLSDIDARKSSYKPIVPDTLDYAVGSVKASETQSGTAKMWTSTNDEGEIGLNISTEV